MPSVETVLLVVALLFIVSILASKASVRLGIPSMLLFVGIGMLAGSDGPGGIYFDHPWATQLVGVSALALILFAAGFETRLDDVRPVLLSAASPIPSGQAATSSSSQYWQLSECFSFGKAASAAGFAC